MSNYCFSDRQACGSPKIYNDTLTGLSFVWIDISDGFLVLWMIPVTVYSSATRGI